MKIALIKEISRKRSNTTSRYHPSVMKMTYHIKSAKKVPNFAARWRAIERYFIGLEKTNNQNERSKYNNNMKKSPPV
jgi:hypothetical protein